MSKHAPRSRWDLSVLIPARNEMFLARTIEDVLEHSGPRTEVIAILDGAWASPPIAPHPRVTTVYLPVSIGQRAATNMAARMSTATYVMKLDAHCAMDDGFDAKLIAADVELGRPDLTQIPAQYNLHVFNWRCSACQFEIYQGPTPTECSHCHAANATFDRVMVWERRKRHPKGNGTEGSGSYVRTEFWRFDHTLHFQYDGAYGKRPEAQGDLADVMSSIGACWFMRRTRYWELGGFDEAHGSWGQYGTELACKSWLSGGRHIVNKRTWYAHLFRTQGGDFGFPYHLSGSAVGRARERSRELWYNNIWEKQIYPLSWLIAKFAPIAGWHTPCKGSDETPEGRTKMLQTVQERGAAFLPNSPLP